MAQSKLAQLLFAHRGASYYAPENTLTALKLAKELGANWVEFDVQLTSDKVPIIFHDDDLTRIGQLHHNGTWQTIQSISSLFEIPWSELQKVNVGRWFPSINAKAAAKLDLDTIFIPTLDEYLGVAQAIGLGINIELKLPEKLYLPENTHALQEYRQHLLQKAIDALQAFNWPNDKVIISSFDLPLIHMAYEKAPQYPRAALYWGQWPQDHFQLAIDTRCQFVHLQAEMLYHSDPSAIQALQRLQKPINVYTVNTQQQALELINMANSHGYSINGFFTDDLIAMES